MQAPDGWARAVDACVQKSAATTQPPEKVRCRNPPRRGLSPAHETPVPCSFAAIGPGCEPRTDTGVSCCVREWQRLDLSLHAIQIIEHPRFAVQGDGDSSTQSTVKAIASQYDDQA
jgi:hypothetical protein